MKGLEPGRQVDQFRIVRKLGQGGMSEVYLARDTTLGRKVALKIIRSELADSPTRLKLFLHEAHLTAKFSHPHIIAIHSVGELEGHPYLALEYLEGQTLSQRMRLAKMSARESMRIGLAIAQALEEAHSHGVLHRDLKPANVVIPQDGRLRVLDFGISKIIEDSIHPPAPTKELESKTKPEETAFGEIKGTPNYMAPERWLGAKVTGESDVWALGVILFQILTHTHPFPGNDQRMEAIARRIVEAQEPPPLPSDIDVPPELSKLISSMLDREVSQRPTAKQVVETLQTLLQSRRGHPLEHKSPFRGLLPFTEHHADLFFGRNAEIEMAVERLRHEPILPIVGPSGAGKSSFVAAGIVPRLRELDTWLVLTVRPGTDPFGTLSSIIEAGWRGDLGNTTSPSRFVALKSYKKKAEGKAHDKAVELEPTQKGTDKPEEADLEVTETATESSVPQKSKSPTEAQTNDIQNEGRHSAKDRTQKLRENPTTLLLELQALADETRCNVLLFVDQLEELYTLEHAPDLRRAYMEAISRAADDPEGPIRVIFTVREDFLSRVVESPSARKIIHKIMILRAPEEEALSEVVMKPVELAGYSYEDEGLPEEMLDAVRDAPSCLPILQFACSQLWNRRNREKRRLTRASYEAMGGVEGALANEADELLAGLSEVQQKAARQLLLRLVTPEGTRRVISPQELLDGLETSAAVVLDRLTAGRVVVSRRSVDKESTGTELELVHDSLVHSWKPLVRWLEQSREEVVFLDEVSRAAELWDSRGRKNNEVWSGEALDEARAKIKRCEAIPNRVKKFLEAGELHRQARAGRRRKIIFAGFGLLLTVIAVLVGIIREVSIQRERALTLMEQVQEKHNGQQLAHANSLREGARAAYIKGDFLEARSKLRSSLETRDSTQARALWWLLENEPLVWSMTLDSFGQCVSVSPNGRLIAASSTSIHLIDTKTLEQRILSGHKNQVFTLDFSPNRRYLASGSIDGEVRLWDLREGTVKLLKGHTNSVSSTVFSPDGKLLASGGDDRTIQLWDIESTTLIRTLECNIGINSIRFSPDGHFIVSVHPTGKILLWNAQHYKLEQHLEERGMGIHDVAISPDGKILAYAGTNDIIVVRDLRTLKILKRLTGNTTYIHSVKFSPNGDLFAASTSEGRVLFWDTKTWSFCNEIHHANTSARSFSFLPEGKQLVSTGHDETLKLWKLDTHSSKKEGAGHSSPIYGLTFAPDGKTIATGSGVDGELLFWDVASSQSIRRIHGHNTPLNDIAFNQNRKLLATGAGDGSVRLYTYPLGQLRKTLYGHRSTVTSVLFSSDGTQLFSASQDRTIAFWDLESLTLQKSLSTRGSVNSIDINPSGRLLASANPLRVQLRNIETGQVQKTFSGHSDAIFSLAFSPDGKSLYSSSMDNTARRYQLGNTSTDGEVVARHKGRIYFIDVTHTTGDVLGTPSADGTAKIWHIETGEVTTLKGHRGEVNRLKFSPDGTLTATVSDDSTLRLWDTKTGRPLWRAPLILEEPPLLLTENGWIRFEDESSPSPFRTTKWYKAAQARAKLASVTGNRETLCLTTFDDELEIWNLPPDKLAFKTKQLGTEQVLSIRNGCLTRSQDSVTLTKATGEAVTLAEQTEAMSRHDDSVFVLQGDTVRILDLEGNGQDEFQATAGASSLTLAGDNLALGFPTGRIEIWRRDGESSQKDFICQEPEGAQVTTIIPGPPGTIIAGFENGALGIWSTDTGERLFSHQLHGPVIHLLLRDQKLYAATELGSRVRFDLTMFYIDYCDLMDRVWREVFWIWEEGRARYREVPSGHECIARR